jgi:hypothetical protein
MRNAFESLENSVNSAIKQLDTKIDTTISHLEGKILQSEYRMTIKLGSIVTVAIAAVVKLL